MFLFWLTVLLMLVFLYAGLVVAGLFDLSTGRAPSHLLWRLSRIAAKPFRRGARDEEAVEEMARRLRGGPGSWPTSGGGVPL